MQKVDIFTDGGCSGNPGPGGWAYVVLSEGKMISYSSGGEAQTTNNRMELNAVIHAIEDVSLLGVDSITISTDSQYVKNGITTWINSWKRNGWKTSSKDPVKNRELWEELDRLSEEENRATGRNVDYKQIDINNVLALPKLLRAEEDAAKK